MSDVERLEKLGKDLDRHQVVLGFCRHGKALAMCYDMPGMKVDVAQIYNDFKHVERVSSADSRTRFDGTCELCANPAGRGSDEAVEGVHP